MKTFAKKTVMFVTVTALLVGLCSCGTDKGELLSKNLREDYTCTVSLISGSNVRLRGTLTHKDGKYLFALSPHTLISVTDGVGTVGDYSLPMCDTATAGIRRIVDRFESFLQSASRVTVPASDGFFKTTGKGVTFYHKNGIPERFCAETDKGDIEVTIDGFMKNADGRSA